MHHHVRFVCKMHHFINIDENESKANLKLFLKRGLLLFNSMKLEVCVERFLFLSQNKNKNGKGTKIDEKKMRDKKNAKKKKI